MLKEVLEILTCWGKTKSYRNVLEMILVDWMENHRVIEIKNLEIEINGEIVEHVSLMNSDIIGLNVANKFYSIRFISDENLLKIVKHVYMCYINIPRISE